MKRQTWIKHRRWQMFLVSTCTRFIAAKCHAVGCGKSSYARSTNVSWDLNLAERQASEWIARLVSDDASNDDFARFEAWRSAHPHHVYAYEKLHSTWLTLSALKGEVVESRFTNNQSPLRDFANTGVHTG